MNKYEELRKMINDSKKIVVFTGAGISCPAPTNIKDFRSSDGLYNQETKYEVEPEEILSSNFFRWYPKEFFEFYSKNLVFPDAIYNEAHKYFADLQEIKDVTVITQNIDNLHTKAGSKKVIELHGNAFRNYCTKCHKYYDLEEIDISDVPVCSCGGIIKHDVVLYGEALNQEYIDAAKESIREADLLIVIGTSLTVNPAASIVRCFNGKYFVIINKSETKYDNKADLVFNEDIINVISNIKTRKRI